MLPQNARLASTVALILLITYLCIPFLTADSRSLSKSPASLRGVVEVPAKQHPPERFKGTQYTRANATLFTLCRNDDLQSLVDTILSWEDRFNHYFHYDWVFLNNEEFTQDFIDITSRLVSGEAKYGVIPEEHWSVPEWINRTHMEEGMRALEAQGIQYSSSESYRHMCRYNSGLFYQHPLMQEYKYYWRVDGDTKMMCDVDFDVFQYMDANSIKYAFTLSMHENMATIPSLWESTVKFLYSYPQYVHANNLGRFVTDDSGKSYNGCHFWTNFEIADADFWRSEAFTTYFDYLDLAGGFFYERWGDAPVHSIAAALMLHKDQIAHFDFVGYFHPPLTHVPSDFLSRPLLRCGQNPHRNFMWDDQYNCIREFYRAQDTLDAIPNYIKM